MVRTRVTKAAFLVGGLITVFVLVMFATALSTGELLLEANGGDPSGIFDDHGEEFLFVTLAVTMDTPSYLEIQDCDSFSVFARGEWHEATRLTPASSRRPHNQSAVSMCSVLHP